MCATKPAIDNMNFGLLNPPNVSKIKPIISIFSMVRNLYAILQVSDFILPGLVRSFVYPRWVTPSTIF
jgi:hypothetical protein